MRRISADRPRRYVGAMRDALVVTQRCVGYGDSWTARCDPCPHDARVDPWLVVDRQIDSMGLLALYGGLLFWHVARLCRAKRTIDDTILLVILFCGGTAILGGIVWGYQIALFCNVVCQVLIGFVLYFRPQLLDGSAELRNSTI